MATLLDRRTKQADITALPPLPAQKYVGTLPLRIRIMTGTLSYFI